MHFYALVIIPADTKNIEAKVEQLMSKYYSELEVESYKEYLIEEKIIKEIEYLQTLPINEIEKMAAAWEIPSDDIRTLAKMEVGDMMGWFEDEAEGIDEIGLYKMTTINPNGKWDYYSLIEKEPIKSGQALSYPCKVSDLPKVLPYAIVTSDGEWYELGEDAGTKAFAKRIKGDNTISEEEANWMITVEHILADYNDSLCVALDCHI
jgi:hypothetical protein